MAGDTNSEETIITAADDLVDWQENVILAYKHPQALNIMLRDNIITIDEESEEQEVAAAQ